MALMIALSIWGGMTVRRAYLDRKKTEAINRKIPRLYGPPEEDEP